MRKFICSVLVVLGAVTVIGHNGPSWAQINITLKFDKPDYVFGEPVGVEVTVSNASGEDLWISRGFSAKKYYLEMRVIDPAGRLLTAIRTEPHDEFPDAPPLAFVDDPGSPGKIVQVAPCEFLPKDWSNSWRTDDLSGPYPMKFPGNYSAQVQISAMIYNRKVVGDPGNEQCEVNETNLLGSYKSDTNFISTQGRTTQVHIVPNQWMLSWKQEQGKPEVQVQIKVVEGNTIDDIRLNTISLNNTVAPSRIEKLPSMLKVFFDTKEAINSLGSSLGQGDVGKWYPVVISGVLENNQFFGGSQKVRIQY